jgi:hypothetical protein
MAITIHLFGFEEGEVTVAHCGRRGIGLSTSKHLAIVTCRECKRKPSSDHRPTIRRPAPAAPADPAPAEKPRKARSRVGR